MGRPDLDAWLADPALRTFHRREAAVCEDALWRAAARVRVGESRLLGRLVRWRIPGVSAEVTYRDLFRSYPFTLLEDGERHSLSGLAGRIWTLQRDYPRFEDPSEFIDWAQEGTARVLFAHWTEPTGAEGAALASEVRVAASGRRARAGIALVRPLISTFEHLIAREALAAAVRRADT